MDILGLCIADCSYVEASHIEARFDILKSCTLPLLLRSPNSQNAHAFFCDCRNSSSESLLEVVMCELGMGSSTECIPSYDVEVSPPRSILQAVFRLPQAHSLATNLSQLLTCTVDLVVKGFSG